MSRFLKSFMSLTYLSHPFSSTNGSYELDVYNVNDSEALLNSNSISSSNENSYDSFFNNYKKGVSTILEWNSEILLNFKSLNIRSRNNFNMACSLYEQHGTTCYEDICSGLKELSDKYKELFNKKEIWEDIQKIDKIGSDRIHIAKKKNVKKIMKILRNYKNQVNDLNSACISSKEVCRKQFFPHGYADYFLCRSTLESFSEEVRPTQEVLDSLNVVEIFLIKICSEEKTYSKSKIPRFRIRND